MTPFATAVQHVRDQLASGYRAVLAQHMGPLGDRPSHGIALPPSPPRPDHQGEFDAAMIDDVRVICTSDEPDQDIVRNEILAAVDCVYANHTMLQTVERHGYWLPTVLDAAILARGVGFVGTTGAHDKVASAADAHRLDSLQSRGAARQVVAARRYRLGQGLTKAL